MIKTFYCTKEEFRLRNSHAPSAVALATYTYRASAHHWHEVPFCYIGDCEAISYIVKRAAVYAAPFKNFKLSYFTSKVVPILLPVQ